MAITILTHQDMIDMRSGQKKVVALEAVATDDSESKVLELADEGMEVKDIAKETGLSSQKIASIIRKGK